MHHQTEIGLLGSTQGTSLLPTHAPTGGNSMSAGMLNGTLVGVLCQCTADVLCSAAPSMLYNCHSNGVRSLDVVSLAPFCT